MDNLLTKGSFQKHKCRKEGWNIPCSGRGMSTGVIFICFYMPNWAFLDTSFSIWHSQHVKISSFFLHLKSHCECFCIFRFQFFLCCWKPIAANSCRYNNCQFLLLSQWQLKVSILYCITTTSIGCIKPLFPFSVIRKYDWQSCYRV